MTAKRSYSDETKAAVMAALLQGQSLGSVAKEYKIPKSTIANWSSDANKTKNNTVPYTKKAEIGDLIIDYLKANLHALRVQVEQFSDREWLRGQDADAVAVLHGVMTDKAIRLLEAFGANDPDTDA